MSVADRMVLSSEDFDFLLKPIKKHLAGTEFDHDQSTHAVGGGTDSSLGQISLSGPLVEDFANGSAAAHLVTGKDGVTRFTPERQKLHDDFVRAALKDIPVSDDPTYFMLGGGTAAGKSTMLRNKAVTVPDKTKRVTADADEAKKALPEYVRMLARDDEDAAAFAHEESSYLTKRVVRAAFENGFDVVLDGTGDGSPMSLLGKIDEARSRGYKVKGFYATIPTEVAVERNSIRAVTDGPDKGRKVPDDYVREIHRDVSRVFRVAVNNMDSVSLYDNTVGSKLIFEASDGRMVFVDQDAYQAFLEKGR